MPLCGSPVPIFPPLFVRTISSFAKEYILPSRLKLSPVTRSVAQSPFPKLTWKRWSLSLDFQSFLKTLARQTHAKPVYRILLFSLKELLRLACFTPWLRFGSKCCHWITRCATARTDSWCPLCPFRCSLSLKYCRRAMMQIIFCVIVRENRSITMNIVDSNCSISWVELIMVLFMFYFRSLAMLGLLFAIFISITSILLWCFGIQLIIVYAAWLFIPFFHSISLFFTKADPSKPCLCFNSR